MHLPQIFADAVGWLAFHLDHIPVLTYTHLLLSALFPIYAGSHASLSRPSSAAKPIKPERNADHPDVEDEEEEKVQHMESLSPCDAIVFPLLAGATLAGLYFVIKWLEDPALLNKILNWYFATFSVLSVARMVSDGLDVLHSLLFPRDYVDGGVLYHVNPKSKTATPVDSGVKGIRYSPLPGPFSRLPLPSGVISILWFLVTVPNRKLKIELTLRNLVKGEVKIGCHGIEGIIVGLTTVLYYNFVGKPWFLTNLVGFGFAYGALQLLSPTTFWTASLILGALFFYDIYFVFYTPMMVSVAKSLDIPVKLLFPAPPRPDADPTKQSLSMLGLGDVVLPGIVVGLALRFDLHLHYLKKQHKNTTSSGSKGSTELTKAPYKSVVEAWGDQLWTSRIASRVLTPMASPSKSAQEYEPGNAFPRPYFHASLVGYVVGMLATLLAMQMSDHPQPALLYLVPGVLSSLWLTAAARGEMKHMWEFSDAFEDEEAKAKKDKEEAKAKKGKEEKEETQAKQHKEQTTDGSHDKQKSDDSEESQSEGLGKSESKDRSRRSEEKDDHAPNDEKRPAQPDDRTLFSLRISLPPALGSATQNSNGDGSAPREKGIFDDFDYISEHDAEDSRRPGVRRSTRPRRSPRQQDEAKNSDDHQDKRARTK